MCNKITLSLISFLVTVSVGTHLCRAQFSIRSSIPMHVSIMGYSSLDQQTLFDGMVTADSKTLIDILYRGQVLLIYENGQQYPLVLEENPFTINIKDPITRPSFTGSPENVYFYKLLIGEDAGETQYDFPFLMINAKQLIDSTSSIRTVEELQAMKKKFHSFVHTHYQNLQHSDMLRRLIAQYFMMHEYVDYNVPGAPTSDFRVQYQEAVMDGIENWLGILKSNIPQHEVLNYCVSLYYERSMVSFGFRIMQRFRDIAYCNGVERSTTTFPPTLNLTDAWGEQKTLEELRGKITIAFISDDCPVSKVETIIKARSLVQQKNETLIVAPLQPLSKTHLSLQRMVNDGNIMFIDDEKWRKENVSLEGTLPYYIQIEEKHPVEIGK